MIKGRGDFIPQVPRSKGIGQTSRISGCLVAIYPARYIAPNFEVADARTCLGFESKTGSHMLVSYNSFTLLSGTLSSQLVTGHLPPTRRKLWSSGHRNPVQMQRMISIVQN